MASQPDMTKVIKNDIKSENGRKIEKRRQSRETTRNLKRHKNISEEKRKRKIS